MNALDENGQTRIKIRVKERVRRNGRGAVKLGRGEKVLLVVLGALIGLGIGYLLAGKLIRYIRPPGAGFKPELAGERVLEMDDRESTPAVTDIEIDLP